MRNTTFWAVIVAIGFAFVVLSRTLLSNEYFYFAGYVVLEYIVLSTAWNILGGYTGYTNFGTGAFFASGAYSSAVLHKLPALLHTSFGWTIPDIPLPVMILVGGIVSGAMGLGTGYLTLRLRGVFFAIATLAFTIVVQTLIVNWDYVGGSRGIYIIRPTHAPLGGGYIQYLFTWMTILVVLSVGIARSIERSRLGLGFAAIRDDEQAAEASGVPTLRLKLISTALSGALMGMAGAPLPYYVTYLDPASSFNLSYAVNSVAMPVIGGMTSWVGPVMGSILLGTVQQLATVLISSAANLLIVGLLLIAFVIIAPNGIVDLLQGPASGPFAPPLGRVQFTVRWFLLNAVITIVAACFVPNLFWIVVAPYWQAITLLPQVVIAAAFFVPEGWLFFIVISTAQLPFASQRLRDAGYSGWFALLLFIPIVNLVVFCALFSAPGWNNSRKSSLDTAAKQLDRGETHA
jgi:branched-chain amino acid transport system permease protein